MKFPGTSDQRSDFFFFLIVFPPLLVLRLPKVQPDMGRRCPPPCPPAGEVPWGTGALVSLGEAPGPAVVPLALRGQPGQLPELAPSKSHPRNITLSTEQGVCCRRGLLLLLSRAAPLHGLTHGSASEGSFPNEPYAHRAEQSFVYLWWCLVSV